MHRITRPLWNPSPFDPWRCQKIVRDPHVLLCTLRSLTIFCLAMYQNSWVRKRSAKKSLIIQSGLFIGLLCSSALAQKTVLPFNEEERLVVKISNKSMNRLSIEGDRIQEVIGLNETVSVEKDGNFGHMFLKVPEGSPEKIEITVITEGGIAQDLTLQPVEKSSTTLVLKADDSPSEDKRSSSASSKKGKSGVFEGQGSIFDRGSTIGLGPTAHLLNTPYQDTLIELMKVLYIGSFEDGDVSSYSRKSPDGIAMNLSRGFFKGAFLGEVFEVSNTSDEVVDLYEQDFYQVGDIALAVEQKSLKPNQKAKLYVIRRGL